VQDSYKVPIGRFDSASAYNINYYKENKMAMKSREGTPLENVLDLPSRYFWRIFNSTPGHYYISIRKKMLIGSREINREYILHPELDTNITKAAHEVYKDTFEVPKVIAKWLGDYYG
jgi:hypothetical protein